MSNIVGHGHILDFFDKVQSAGRLNHAYCFVGRESLGKRAVAEHIAGTLVGVSRAKIETHPDVQIVTQEKDEKTGKTKKGISVSQLARVRSFLSQRPYLGEHKIVIIDNAEKMNANAANALLKTLEEPRPYAMLFLVTTDETLLPMTIQSRCQKIFFQSVGEDELQKYLDGQKIDTDRTKQFVDMAHGLPGRVISWARDGELFEKHIAEVERFNALLGQPLYKKMKLVEDLFGDKTDHIATRDVLVHTLKLWEVMVGRHSYGSAEKQHIQSKQAPVIYARIHEAIQLLGKNIHPKLLIEHILFAIP